MDCPRTVGVHRWRKNFSHVTLSIGNTKLASETWAEEGVRCFWYSCAYLPQESQQNGDGQHFLHIFTLGKWSSMSLYPEAHLIKGKHIYHLIKACLMATWKWRLRWKYLSNPSSGTSVRGTLWQATEVLISQYQNNLTHNIYLRRCHWWFLLVYCGYRVPLMCLLELSRWTKWMDRCQKNNYAY